jgi:hypothetical protein
MTKNLSANFAIILTLIMGSFLAVSCGEGVETTTVETTAVDSTQTDSTNAVAPDSVNTNEGAVLTN